MHDVTATNAPTLGRAVLFDVGGTLASNGPVVAIAARLLGLPTTGEGVRTVATAVMAHRPEYDRTGDDVTYWQRVSDDSGGPRVTPAVVEQLVAADVQRWARLSPSVMHLLRELRRADVRMGVLSNAPLSLARTFDNQSWSEMFAVQRFGCFTQLTKPAPAAFEDAVDHLGVPAERVVYFDDRLDNVDAGAAVGLDAHLWQGADHARALLLEREILGEE